MDTQVLRGKDQSRWQQTRNRYCHPIFGYKNHIAIDARFGFIRSYAVTNAAKHDGKVLRDIVTRGQCQIKGVGGHRLSFQGQ